jgi:hypothetical protein
MGSDTGGYVRLRLETHHSKYDGSKGVLRRVSELGFERAPSPSSRTLASIKRAAPETSAARTLGGPGPLSAAPARAKPVPAGKVALGGLARAEVVSFELLARMDDDSVVDMRTEPDDAYAAEARAAFGGTWAGFAVLAAPSGTRFRLIADIEFKPCWPRKAKRPFQVIPVVMAFGTDRFEDHYLLALIVAQRTEERVDTSVTQPYQ